MNFHKTEKNCIFFFNCHFHVTIDIVGLFSPLLCIKIVAFQTVIKLYINCRSSLKFKIYNHAVILSTFFKNYIVIIFVISFFVQSMVIYYLTMLSMIVILLIKLMVSSLQVEKLCRWEELSVAATHIMGTHLSQSPTVLLYYGPWLWAMKTFSKWRKW